MKERAMFYGANNDTFKKAYMLRSNETNAEKLLWKRLNKSQLNGLRFKRQHPIGFYIADFYCHKAKLIIEVDEPYHELTKQKRYDENRTNEMKALGLQVIRFSDDQTLADIEKVIEEIKKNLAL